MPDNTLSDSPSSKALFLDFDGVLHEAAKAAELARGQIPADLIAYSQKQKMFCWNFALENLLAMHPDVMVFVHSSWRKHVDNQGMRTLLGPLAHRFMGVSPKESQRHKGIVQLAARAGVHDYRILDDMPSEFSDCPELIVCEPDLGVSDLRVHNALNLWLQGGH